MNEQYNRSVGVSAETDLGLKSFMLGTYRYMAMAMAVTAGMAYLTGQYLIANPSAMKILYNPIMSLVVIGVIMVGFGIVGKKLPSMSLGGVLTFLFGFAAFMGVIMSGIGMMYSPVIIAKIFFMTVAMFAGLSLFGYTTGFNLGSIIKYAIIAFMAYIAINVLGMFVPALAPTGMMDMVITAVALVAISIIIAWETQMLKRIYYGSVGNPAMMKKLSAFGAASLLLSFINLFQILLSLFGRE
jgi:FtsH-binding integral membrane protein